MIAKLIKHIQVDCLFKKNNFYIVQPGVSARVGDSPIPPMRGLMTRINCTPTKPISLSQFCPADNTLWKHADSFIQQYYNLPGGFLTVFGKTALLDSGAAE
jgi:hypothetical protein